MGVKFGEIDANQILENEFRINVLEKMISEIFIEEVLDNVTFQRLRRSRRFGAKWSPNFQKKYQILRGSRTIHQLRCRGSLWRLNLTLLPIPPKGS